MIRLILKVQSVFPFDLFPEQLSLEVLMVKTVGEFVNAGDINYSDYRPGEVGDELRTHKIRQTEYHGTGSLVQIGMGSQHLFIDHGIDDIHDDPENDDAGHKVPDDHRQLPEQEREDLYQHDRIKTKIRYTVELGTEIRFATHPSGNEAVYRIAEAGDRINDQKERRHRFDEYQNDSRQ